MYYVNKDINIYRELPALQDKRNPINFNINLNLKFMTTFIIVSLMILVLIITILYVHKVITSSHLEEELITVFKNLSNINAYINNISETPSQSPNTEIKETDITNVKLVPLITDIITSIKDINESDSVVKIDNIHYMRNGGSKCHVCSVVDKSSELEPCKTCISSGTKCNFIQDKNITNCINCSSFTRNIGTCLNCNESNNEFVLHVE